MREYRMVIGGITHTVQLSDDEAKQLGVTDRVATRAAKPPANKARSRTRNKEE